MTNPGPGDIGRVEIDVDLSVQEAIAKLTQFNKYLDDTAKRIRNLGGGTGLSQAQKDLLLTTEAAKGLNAAIAEIEKQSGGRQLLPDQQRAIDQLKQLRTEVQEAFGEKTISLPGAQLTGFDKAAQSAGRLEHAAQQTNKVISAGVPVISSADKAIRSYGLQQLKAAEANEVLGSSTTKSTNPLKSFTLALASGDSKLKEMGLSVRGISVLLGAGLATGIVGIIRIIEQFSKKIADFVGGEIELQRQTNLTFGSASESVNRFADSSAHDLGASRDEAIKTANAFASFGRTIGVTSVEQSATFSTELTRIAAALAQTQPGFKGTEDAAKTLEQALGGDVKALEALGVSITTITELAQKNFGKLPDQLTPAEQAFVGIKATAQSAADAVGEIGLKPASGLQQFKDFFKELGVDETTVANLKEATTLVQRFISTGLERNNPKDLAEFQGIVNNLTTTQLENLRKEAKGNKELDAAIDEVLTTRKKDHDAILSEATAGLVLADVQAQNLALFKASNAEQIQAVGLATTLARAIEDGQRRIDEANIQGKRAIEDNAKRTRDTLQKNARAEQDAALAVNNAEQRLSDARQDRTIRDRDAAQAFAATQLEVFRANRSAAEKLQDFERDSARKLFDLQEAVRRARHADAQDAFAVQVQIVNARIRGQNALVQQGSAELASFLQQGAAGGTNQLADAEKNLARFQEDHAIDLKRLQRDVVETRLDGVTKLKKATQDQAKAELESSRAVRDATNEVTRAKLAQQRAIEDATNATNDLTTANNRALEDARRARDNAIRERDRSIHDAEKALQEFVATLGISIQDLDNIIKPLLDPKVQQALQNWIERMNSAVDFATLNFGFGAPGGAMAGADLTPGHPVIWNEPAGGGELLITPSGGTVISHADFIRLIRQLEKQGAGGGRPVNVTVNEVAQDPQATAFRVSREIMKQVT